jgi:hypothetical protein
VEGNVPQKLENVSCRYTHSSIAEVDKSSTRIYISLRDPTSVPVDHVYSIQSLICFSGFVHLFFHIHDDGCKSPAIASVPNTRSGFHNLHMAIITSRAKDASTHVVAG